MSKKFSKLDWPLSPYPTVMVKRWFIILMKYNAFIKLLLQAHDPPTLPNQIQETRISIEDDIFTLTEAAGASQQNPGTEGEVINQQIIGMHL